MTESLQKLNGPIMRSYYSIGRPDLLQHRDRDPPGVPPALPMPPLEDDILRHWGPAPGKPVVSVVCHTYNHAPFLEAALRGFLGQVTPFPFEVIVRDDASSDGAQQVIREYANRYPRIVRGICEQSNTLTRGVRPFSVTFPMVRGDYIAMCEGDDYWTHPDKLRAQVAVMAANPSAGMCVHPALGVDYRTGLSGWSFCDHGGSARLISVREIFYLPQQFAPTSSYLMRASFSSAFLDFAQRWPTSFADFFIEAIASRGTLAYIPDRMSVYRRDHAGSYSASESRMESGAVVARYRMNVAATLALTEFPWIEPDWASGRVAFLRLDCARKLADRGDANALRAVMSEGSAPRQILADYSLSALGSRWPRLAIHGYRAIKLAGRAARSIRRASFR